MDCHSVQHTFFFILLALLVGQGDGRWKKTSREMLQHDIKLFKKMTERLKEELGSYYEEMSDEPFADYFLEEIDYMQSRIDNDIKRKAKIEKPEEINNSHVHHPNDDNQIPQHYTRDKDTKISINNVTIESSNRNNYWPSFEEILNEMGKKYDWKNDRWIKVKNKVKNKPANSKSNVEHNIKHNFKYRIVKLNRAKSKRNIVVAVTAVR